ncbi:GIY-YIG nuclease family protein [Gracilimonas mengyeensis]|uniref:Putative endonuclease n=1 Tax=Gracilimonas mengyeensis TaxID=1302730 RepID=A0A521FM76_9BACT|nr:GIY-YIG nuclease family protein [Gracilimonas mengyeensis]SMO96710.1 putative endonuclease [Gracilimonas mengyeensis]
MSKKGYLYILSNKHRTVYYTGVTSQLLERVYDHRRGRGCHFTKKYNIRELLYYEEFPTMLEAIQAEKRVKRWKQAWKIELIKTINPEMVDLWSEVSTLGQPGLLDDEDG